jgi:hypothetical protein
LSFPTKVKSSVNAPYLAQIPLYLHTIDTKVAMWDYTNGNKTILVEICEYLELFRGNQLKNKIETNKYDEKSRFTASMMTEPTNPTAYSRFKSILI